MSRIAAVAIVLCLAACGMKGTGLELPPGPAPEPLLGNPKKAPTPPATPDGSTLKPRPSP